MGGLLHLFDFNQGNMARKVISHKRRVDGLEAPRNSLELQAEASQSWCSAGDEPNPFLFEENWSENNCYPVEASMKKLINEEMSKQPRTKKNAPSIVARLMGVDMLPMETKSLVQPIDRKNRTTETKLSKKEKNERGSVTHLSRKSYSATQMEFESLYNDKATNADRWSDGKKLGKPRPREHPQEEELQKFKREFEAWQATRFNECSKFVEFGKTPGHLIAKENINEQKLVLNDTTLPMEEIPTEYTGLAWKQKSLEQCGLQHYYRKTEPFLAEQMESLPSKNRTRSRSAEHFSVSYGQKLDSSAAPTRIVILKPGPDRIYDHEECWNSSSGTLEDRGSIEDFLEEVKERLKCELQGKTVKRGSLVRGSGIETPFSEKSPDPKQIAHHIAKHVRESVTRDLGVNLPRSESTRSYRSEVQFNGVDSPEFINRDARRFLSERLRNVLRKQSHVDAPPNVSGVSGPSCLDNGKVRVNLVGEVSRTGNEPSYWEIVGDEPEMQTRSFRHGDYVGLQRVESSPRNLIRSLSAPVSGTSFGKLLLEDRHILTGAHIRRKHESPEHVSVELKKLKKEKLNIKAKVSNFRHNFTLRGRLFGKKIQPMLESNRVEQDFIKDIMSGPTSIVNLGERHIMENSTEVPPSPASVCSTQEELWRPTDYLSAVSTPDITLEDDKAMPQVLKEISSNLNELRRQLNQLQSGELDITTTEQEPVEFLVDELEDEAEAYIRDLLVASGLYNRSFDKNLLRWNTIAKPISNSVFEELEERSRKLAKNDETEIRDHNWKKVDRKIIFDLLNESLSTLFGPFVTKVRVSRRMIASSVLPHLCGRKLLDCVWESIRDYLYPANDKSYYLLENMVAKNLASNPWSLLIDDEVNDLAKEVESQILGNILEEIVKDMNT